MNDFEIISLIYDGSEYRGFSDACSEIRHDRNRGDCFGRLGFYLNGARVFNQERREEFLNYLRICPISRSISIDSRYLEDEEVLSLLRGSNNLREIRIIDNGYQVTNEIFDKIPADVIVICDEVSDDITEQNINRVYAQHGIFKKETNYVEDDLVSAYFINHDLSEEELDYLIGVVNDDNSGNYSQISFRVYNPSSYKDLITKLHERGLREDVRINLLGNPLYDRFESYDGLDDISNNQINITYDTCSDMINFYTEEPYTVSNIHHSELEGGGKANLDSYVGMLNLLEQQEEHIKNQGYSPLEAAIYAYHFLQENYAYDPVYEITDSANYLKNRQLDLVANDSIMVCKGYATLYSAFMRRCGIPMFRYSTYRHVRNIGRIVDQKYGVDSIDVFDSTVDGSHILEGNVFDVSRKFAYFMFSPREATHFDPYVTIPTSLVIDYATSGSEYLSHISRDPYESALSLTYSPDGYAMTMLDRMGIELPEPLTFDNYREFLSQLNNTSIFDSINPSIFNKAYEHVLRTEYPNLNEYEIISLCQTALISIYERLNQVEGSSAVVCINNGQVIRETDNYQNVVMFPCDYSRDISEFNKSSSESQEENRVNIEEMQGDVVTHEIEGASIQGAVANEVVDEDDTAELIPGTNIRKPRGRGDYETDEEYVSYLADYYGRYFPQASEQSRQNDTTYAMRRHEIIQDLPIYSDQETRFTGVMNETEIQESSGKMR